MTNKSAFPFFYGFLCVHFGHLMRCTSEHQSNTDCLFVCVYVCALQVHTGWVLDTDVFNEWMNEEDYCVDERNVPIILRRRIHLRDEQVGVTL